LIPWLDVPPAWLLRETRARAARLHDPAPPLRPEEAEAVARAVPVRVREFAYGRATLRAALRDVGWEGDAPILRRPDRTPTIPDGFVASLSHTADLAVAVAAPAGHWRSLGVDVERRREMDASVARIVATPRERHLDVLSVFSAKEALFKAWYAAGGGRILEFEEIVIDLSPDGTITVLEQPPPLLGLVGRVVRTAAHCWSVAGAPSPG
jgi:4'-phosphopantetheinyl transferase EntD